MTSASGGSGPGGPNASRSSPAAAAGPDPFGGMPGHSHATAVADGIANPRSVGSLLAEECTMNPLTVLPSFLEMNLVDATNVSGRRTLHQVLHGLRAKCDDVVRAGMVGTAASGRSNTAISALRVRLASYLSRLLTRYRSELILIVMYGVERYSLQKSSATAAEGVYGMKRSRVVMERGGDGNNSNNDGGGIRLAPLTQGDRARCAIVAALLPYLREKWAVIYRKMQPLEDGGGASPSVSAISTQTPTRLERIRHKLLTIFRTVYPYLSMTTEGASLAYQFLYLAGMTGYYSPSMHVLGVLTRRITRADLQHQQQHHHQQGKQHVQQQSRARSAAKQSHSHANGTVPPADSSVRGMMESGSKSSPVPSGIGTAVMSSLQSGKADHVVRAIRTAIIVGGSTLLVTGWVAHFREELRQRRRRWIAGEDGTTDHDSENLQQRQQRLQGRQGVNTIGANRNIWTEQSNPIPPPHPPTLLDESESEYVRRGLPTDTSSCPICHRRRVNPAASTSGHVFCYRCLVMHLRSHGERCPLTGMHCPESRVIRLFEPTATGTAGAEMPSDGRNRKEEVGKEQGAGQSTGFDR